ERKSQYSKYTESEERVKRALDEEADRARIEQVVEDEDISEAEAWEIGIEEGTEEHFTKEEEES
ncbi:MAG TPA: hypothetical protein PLP86_13405, partial [Armatimonadota bacterium]|nr:hypothetical protein [Armatimonadota bacterium]